MGCPSDAYSKKGDDSIKCGDYKVIINLEDKVDTYFFTKYRGPLRNACRGYNVHVNANLFGCLLLPEPPTHVPVPHETILLMETLSSIPVTATHISQWTSQCAILLKVKKVVLYGWNHVMLDMPNSYWQCCIEPFLVDGCIFPGNRVMVLPERRIRVMDLFHEGHLGIIRMKTLAFSLIWLTQIDHVCRRKFRYVILVNI